MITHQKDLSQLIWSFHKFHTEVRRQNNMALQLNLLPHKRFFAFNRTLLKADAVENRE